MRRKIEAVERLWGWLKDAEHVCEGGCDPGHLVTRKSPREVYDYVTRRFAAKKAKKK